ncbi:MAG: transcription termination/antitermination protein NusG [Candidatus Margulisbacteria bacterium]|nr:transcription termination/antitermination protein NusG [Candidatus Margulisiibacteriota bacterium]MBU1021040.1 transcription termination/antitermination protein NusG [Candidatus Margulisiibacteriota bacterium]MBU1729715.1 transcription termination/antitermination protein NusG [Candidatus Margulisiibacteriota bacterium]MBU1955980.1 transcription termination/antitermination protein NusG [Candidatus Margulisiibacteriota bacterium]
MKAEDKKEAEALEEHKSQPEVDIEAEEEEETIKKEEREAEVTPHPEPEKPCLPAGKEIIEPLTDLSKEERKSQQEINVEIEEEDEVIKDEASPEERRWFVIQTYSGQEDKVKASIERTVAQMNMGHKIFRVLVPEEETLEIKGSKRIEKVRKMFPGYVFVEMALDDESWYAIRQTPGVARFIGSSSKPQPVIDREMQRVLKQIGVKEERLEVAFDIGETVRVISGPFRGYSGTVNEVNAAKGKLKILISIFGRDTPVEVNFEHAEKMT